MTTQEVEFGLDSFVPLSVDDSGRELSGDVVIHNTVEEAVLADAVGIDSFNIAEHYRQDMMDSAGHVILAAIAGRTEHIRLGTAVTVLSTQDPVRVYTQFATLDAVSNGRAQLILGRGSLTESFPLFGYDLSHYEELFEEHLDLFTRLLRDQPVTWSGKFRSALTNQYLSPPLPEGHLPTWVGVGGSPQSVIRAARYGLPLMLAVIGGSPIRFAPLVDLYGRALEKYGYPQLGVGLHSHGFIANTDQEAARIFNTRIGLMSSRTPPPNEDGPIRRWSSSKLRSRKGRCTWDRRRPLRTRLHGSSDSSVSVDSTWPMRRGGFPTNKRWRPSSSTDRR